MTTLTLPPIPTGLSTELTYNSKSAVQNPPLGGPKTRISRMGDYWTQKVTPQHMSGAQGSMLMGYIEMASTADKLRMPVKQDFVVPSIGTMCVDGALQAGRILQVRNVPTDFPFQSGMLFNIISGGVYYLHRLLGATPVSMSGDAQWQLQINPMIKAAALADGDGLEFQVPMIEGWVDASVSGARGFVGAIATTINITEAI
jgi:hypothetical protein